MSGETKSSSLSVSPDNLTILSKKDSFASSGSKEILDMTTLRKSIFIKHNY